MGASDLFKGKKVKCLVTPLIGHICERDASGKPLLLGIFPSMPQGFMRFGIFQPGGNMAFFSHVSAGRVCRSIYISIYIYDFDVSAWTRKQYGSYNT